MVTDTASGPGAPRRLVVVGGGISGLAAAHRAVELAGGALEVVVLEAGDRAGGVIATEHAGDFLVEGGPDSFVMDKPQAADLCRRLGLAGELIPTNERYRRTLVLRDGALIPLPEAFQLLAPGSLWPFLRSPILSWRGRLRALGDLVVPRGGPPSDGDESLASFVRRRLGDEVLERIAQPMVGGIYTADPETLSLASTMPRFLEMERRHRSVIVALHRQVRATAGTSGARFGLFATLRGGVSSLVDALVARLPANALRTRSQVSSLARAGRDAPAGGAPGWRLRLADGSTLDADAVIVALPAPRAAEVLTEVDASLSGELSGIPCASSAIVSLAFRRRDVPRPLDAFGVVVPEIERRRIIACSFSSVKYDGRAPADAVLLRAFVGGAMHPDLFALDDVHLLRAVREELRSLLGVTAEPELVRLHRWPESMPQYHVGHAARAARIRGLAARLPGLALAGNSLDGVGLSDCIRTGEAAAESLLRALGERTGEGGAVPAGAAA